ncbi:hypothetical protein FKM82_021283 [Ascaphus truei]
MPTSLSPLRCYARSLFNKFLCVYDIFFSHALCYLFAITETCLTLYDSALDTALSNSVFSFSHTTCPDGRSGGVELLPLSHSLSVPSLEAHTVHLFSPLHVAAIYQSPTSTFLSDFESVLSFHS